MTTNDANVVLVTGATDGLGHGVAMALARQGLVLLVHGRDPARIAATAEELRRGGASAVRTYQADLQSLDEVRAFASAVMAGEERLDVLVNNAGIGTRVPGGGARMQSRDGHELRFAVNYLSHYALTRLLLPLIERSAPSRIVNVSSVGQAPIDFEDPMLSRHYDGTQAYCQSKLAQIMFTIDLSEELRGRGVTVNALHPATYMPTKIVQTPMSTLAEGVEATVHLATGKDVARITGRYFDGLQESRAHPQAYDAAARKKLRALSDRISGARADLDVNAQITAAGPEERGRLEALFELYTYDFSEVLGLDVGDDGRFHAPALDAYWTDPRRHAFLIRVDGRLAGFALVDERSRLASDAEVNHPVRDVAEFFVMRRYRRHGVGEHAARWLFDRFRGRWEVRQRAENQAATAFWRRAIGRYTGGRFEEVMCDDERWRGPVQRFESMGLSPETGP